MFSTSCVWLHPIIWRRTIPQSLSMSRMWMTIRPFSRDPHIVLKLLKRMIATCPNVCCRSLKQQQKKIRNISCSLQLSLKWFVPLSICCHCSSICLFTFFVALSPLVLHMYIKHTTRCANHRILNLVKHQFYCMSWVSYFSFAWDFTAQLVWPANEKKTKETKHKLSLLFFFIYLFIVT